MTIYTQVLLYFRMSFRENVFIFVNLESLHSLLTLIDNMGIKLKALLYLLLIFSCCEEV